jgi:hypothetical protein
VRHWFLIDRARVERREALLIAQEDVAIRLARDEAPTRELRAFVERVIAERERNRREREQ